MDPFCFLIMAFPAAIFVAIQKSNCPREPKV